jgi:hypothetical protein
VSILPASARSSRIFPMGIPRGSSTEQGRVPSFRPFGVRPDALPVPRYLDGARQRRQRPTGTFRSRVAAGCWRPRLSGAEPVIGRTAGRVKRIRDLCRLIEAGRGKLGIQFGIAFARTLSVNWRPCCSMIERIQRGRRRRSGRGRRLKLRTVREPQRGSRRPVRIGCTAGLFRRRTAELVLWHMNCRGH